MYNLAVRRWSMESWLDSSDYEVREESSFNYSVRWAITIVSTDKRVLECKKANVEKTGTYITLVEKGEKSIINENHLK